MAQGTKITFSNAELDAISKPDFFYIKHNAMQKIMELFGQTERELRKIVLTAPELAKHTSTDSPKIFRGENYRQLPYMVLDYPRKFNTDTVFAFRSMFWWGKEFSFTLHLQGRAWAFFKKGMAERMAGLEGKEFYSCVNTTPWQYHFEKDNYRPLDELIAGGKTGMGLEQRDFIKLSRKIPAQDVERVPVFAAETFAMLIPLF